MTFRSKPGRVRESSAQERLVAHAYASAGRRNVLRCRGHERPEGHEQLVHGNRVRRRLRRRFDLDAKLALRGVRAEVAWGCPAAGTDVREEPEGADVCEGVGEGEDVVADWRRCGIFFLFLRMIMLIVVELVDVEGDLVWPLGRN